MRYSHLRLSAQLCVLAFLLLLTSAATAQAQDQEDVVKTKSNLVSIDVIVKDKKGKYISDLKPEDFTITEDGLPQKLEFFDAPIVRIETRTPRETTAPTAVASPGTTATATRNYIALILDSQTTDFTNLKAVREGAIRYVREQVTDADAVAILSVTNGLQMLQPFTQDKTKLIASLEKLGSPDAKSFEQKETAENIANLRDFINNASSAPITSNAGGAEAARVLIAQHVLQQF
ncbi:MAG TPA: VWA domain-containing protein, partial [Pyrinomonadaceae bacterium]|nr:VWA domain-containing protein [Pyrinomonadaceae bacterium]